MSSTSAVVANKRRGPGRPGTTTPTVPADAEILRVGLETFAELGFDATTVRELARRLGVSHNFINDRFGNKEHFWRAVVDDALGADLHRGLTDVLGARHPTELDRLTAVIRFVVRRANPLLHQMMSDEAMRPSTRMDYIVQKDLQPMILGLTPVLAALERDGVIRPVPWTVLLFLMSAPSHVHAQGPLVQALGESLPDDLDTTELFTSLILNALRPPT
ncbi:MAG TPA: helix-turn-helix domain-containing protein, partial [Myxococcota bacterium]